MTNVTDNDTLFEVRLCVRSANDTTIIPMVRTEDEYAAYWTVPQAGRYWYRIEGEDFWENTATYPDTGWLRFHTEGYRDAVDPTSPHPTAFSLSIFPNPFNSTAQIEFTLPVTQRVSLKLYDVLGREVAVLLNEMQTAGEHRVRFDGGGLSSGVYFCRMEAGTETRTQKVVLMK